MRIVQNIKRTFAIVSAAALLLAALPTGIVGAANGNPTYCDSEVPRLENKNFGAKVPVVLVHGLWGDDTDWGSIHNRSSFAGRVNNIPGVAVAHRFDYDWSKWVTYHYNGPRLAKTIDCISRLSVQNGGRGKVIVVGYSMGGLVARDATQYTSSDGQRNIADEIGQAITIGTPHDGTNIPTVNVPLAIARGFMKGSNELAQLPHFSARTKVHTIAGELERVYYNFWGQEVKREYPHDDSLVPVASAHAEATDDAAAGGGQKTIHCTKRYINMLVGSSWSWYRDLDPDAPCEHGRLIQDAGNGVREDTIDAIKKYAAWLNAQPETTSFTVGTITVAFDDRWTNTSYGAAGPNGDIVGQDLTNGTPCTNCTTTPPPTVYPGILIVNMATWCDDGRTMMECLTSGLDNTQVVGPAPDITVGGRTPDSSIRFVQSNHTHASRMFWCFENEKVCIDYGTGADVDLEPSLALRDLLHDAIWSD